MVKSPSVSDDDCVPRFAPPFPFAITGVVDTPPGVLGRGVRPSPFALLPLLELLRPFCRPGVNPPPNGVATLRLRASFAASVRAAGVKVTDAAAATAPPRESRDRRVPGVLPPPGVRSVPVAGRPVPGVIGVNGVADA